MCVLGEPELCPDFLAGGPSCPDQGTTQLPRSGDLALSLRFSGHIYCISAGSFIL